MLVEETDLPGVLMITPPRFVDHRGYFTETYHASKFGKFGVDCVFVQDNQSLSAAVGTIRGLHFQTPPTPQAKLVRVLAGAVFDVAVDLRVGSPTYGRWTGRRLSAEGGEQLFVPRGFAHGFCTLEPNVIISYKVDGYYAPECDAALHWADLDIGVRWPLDNARAVVSEKDEKAPSLKDFRSPFRYAD